VLRFSCPHCGATLKAAPGKAGATATCPRCKGGLTVPGLAAATALPPAGRDDVFRQDLGPPRPVEKMPPRSWRQNWQLMLAGLCLGLAVLVVGILVGLEARGPSPSRYVSVPDGPPSTSATPVQPSPGPRSFPEVPPVQAPPVQAPPVQAPPVQAPPVRVPSAEVGWQEVKLAGNWWDGKILLLSLGTSGRFRYYHMLPGGIPDGTEGPAGTWKVLSVGRLQLTHDNGVVATFRYRFVSDVERC
jgi:hypothetical protein